MTRPAYVFRAAAFLSGGAYAVHQLRYELGFGDHASHALHAHGHGYLSAVAPVISLLLAAALGQLLWAAAQKPIADERRPLGFGRLWALVSVALVAVYTGQELLEGVFAHGHPTGLAGAFADGGWIAIPLAIAVGALLAVGLRVAAAIERSSPPALVETLSFLVVPVAAPAVARVATPRATGRPLAQGRAGRAPPR